MTERTRRVVNAVGFALVLAGVGFYVGSQFESLQDFSFKLNWSALIGATLSALLAAISAAECWRRIARSNGLNLRFIQSAEVWASGRLARYLPGKIAPYLLRWHRYGYDQGFNVAAASADEIVVSVFSISVFCGIALLFVDEGDGYLFLSSALILSSVSVLLLTSHLRKWIGGYLSRRLNKTFDVPPTDPVGIAAGSLIYGTSLIFHSAVIILTLHSLGVSDWNHLPFIISAYFLAGVAGMLAPFAPAGLGVREALALGAFSTVLEPDVSIIAVAILRLLSIIAESLVALSAFTSAIFVEKMRNQAES